MVNKKNSGGRSVLLSSLFLFSLFFFHIKDSQSQNISNHYASTLQDNGLLYYIYPMDGFKEMKGRDKLSFDITYLTSADSIDVHISIYSSKEISPDSLSVRYDSTKLTVPLKKIFVESHRKGWHYRYKLVMPFTNLQHIFQSSTTPTLGIIASSQRISMEMRGRKWKKRSAMVRKILKIMQHNR